MSDSIWARIKTALKGAFKWPPQSSFCPHTYWHRPSTLRLLVPFLPTFSLLAFVGIIEGYVLFRSLWSPAPGLGAVSVALVHSFLLAPTLGLWLYPAPEVECHAQGVDGVPSVSDAKDSRLHYHLCPVLVASTLEVLGADMLRAGFVGGAVLSASVQITTIPAWLAVPWFSLVVIPAVFVRFLVEHWELVRLVVRGGLP